MSETIQGNVLKFKDFDKAGRNFSGAEALSIIHTCRDTLIQGVTMCLMQKGNDIKDSLLEQADRALGLEARNAHYDALEILNKHSQELTERLRQEIAASIDRISTSKTRNSEISLEGDGSELGLIDDDSFEETLTLNKLSSRLRFQCSEQLTALDSRMAVLMNNPGLKEDANPFGPRNLYTSFIRSSEPLHGSLQARLVLLQEFDHQISSSLANIYREINRQLVEKGVLPKITLGLASRPTRSVSTPPGPHDTSLEDQSDTDFLKLLKRLAGLGTGQYAASLPAGSIQEPIMGAPAPHMLQALTCLQRGDLSGLPDLDSEQAAAGNINVLHALRASPVVTQASQLDTMTIDIVAMLFDYFFDDVHIHDSLKALIGRLQIPVLKVAMLDKHFFSNKKHPARQLLDVMASAAVGWSREEEPRLFAKIGECVDVIVDRFEEDFSVFSEQLVELERFLEAEERKADNNTGHVMEDMERKERSEIAAVVADDQVKRRTGHQALAPLIAEFLDKMWRSVLTDIYILHGEQSERWVRAIESMDDLIWSVSPKIGTDERLRLVSLLPDLLKRLRGGLDDLEMSEQDKDAFFSKLVFLHAQAVRAGLEPTVQIDDAPAGVSAQINEETIPASVPPSHTEESISPALTPTLESTAQESVIEVEDEFVGMARGLELNTWLEFKQPDDSVKTLKLSWVSRLKGIYLFTNRQGLDAVSLALTRLAARLADGSARVIEGSQLTERAVDRLMNTLQRRA
jgi:Protein of unknown function (DUF1631)